jgi:thioesterase domain-containing protein
MVNLSEVTAYLHGEIPITRAMGIEVIAWDGTTVSLAAPLAPNQNHADTAFGGSIATLGILAGYSLLHVVFLERKLSTRILIQKSETEYMRPIDEAMTATAAIASPVALEELLETMRRKRRARMEIESKVICRKMLAATHRGLFVAMKY